MQRWTCAVTRRQRPGCHIQRLWFQEENSIGKPWRSIGNSATDQTQFWWCWQRTDQQLMIRGWLTARWCLPFVNDFRKEWCAKKKHKQNCCFDKIRQEPTAVVANFCFDRAKRDLNFTSFFFFLQDGFTLFYYPTPYMVKKKQQQQQKRHFSIRNVNKMTNYTKIQKLILFKYKIGWGLSTITDLIVSHVVSKGAGQVHTSLGIKAEMLEQKLMFFFCGSWKNPTTKQHSSVVLRIIAAASSNIWRCTKKGIMTKPRWKSKYRTWWKGF